MLPTQRIVGAFTVDVEDYFHVTAFERNIRREDWSTIDSRVENSTQRLLDLLARHQVEATFFVLGWVAERFPELVRRIASVGHELGSHSYWHRLVYDQTPDEFRSDLRRSLNAIQAAAGVEVKCFRAPSFSITKRSLWALEILAEEGIRVDSSIFPTRHDRYGIPESDPRIHLRETPAGAVVEFPPTVAKLCGVNLPVGGGYFRLYPMACTRFLLKRVQDQQRPLMFYVHPWEVDPDQPRMRVGTRFSRFRHYVNLATTSRKLDALLATTRLGSIRQVLERVAPSPEVRPAVAAL